MRDALLTTTLDRYRASLSHVKPLDPAQELELARRWRFPAGIVQGLDSASDPLATVPFCPLGGVVHLAGWLADMAFTEPEVLDALPSAVVAKLDLDLDWMHKHMPQPDSFLDITSL